MAFVGNFGPDSSATSALLRSTRYDINVGSTSVSTVGTINLDNNRKGHHLISCGYGPSDNSNNYRNNDPDDWAFRCYYNGSQVGDTMLGEEGTPRTYRDMNFGTWMIRHTGGNANIEIRFSKQYANDPDGGGMRGQAYVTINQLTQE